MPHYARLDDLEEFAEFYEVEIGPALRADSDVDAIEVRIDTLAEDEEWTGYLLPGQSSGRRSPRRPPGAGSATSASVPTG